MGLLCGFRTEGQVLETWGHNIWALGTIYFVFQTRYLLENICCLQGHLVFVTRAWNFLTSQQDKRVSLFSSFLSCVHILVPCFLSVSKPLVKSCHRKRWRKVSPATGCLLWQYQQVACRKDDFLSTIPVISFYFPNEHQYEAQLSKSPRSSHLPVKDTPIFFKKSVWSCQGLMYLLHKQIIHVSKTIYLCSVLHLGSWLFSHSPCIQSLVSRLCRYGKWWNL